MNVYCVECGASVYLFLGRWMSSTPCTVGGPYHVADPLDVAARRVNEAKDAVRAAKAELAECRKDYDYLKAIRVPPARR